MKNYIIHFIKFSAALTVILILTNSSCENSPPSCQIINPPDNTIYEIGDTILFSVDAIDLDGAVEEVKFLLDGSEASSVKSAPYNWTWATANEESGQRKILVNAIDDEGAVAEDEITIILEQPDTLEQLDSPVASFTMDANSGVSPVTVQFTNTSENAKEFLWDFGDQSFSEEENPVHSFNYDPITGKDKYIVTLHAYSENEESVYSRKITALRNLATNNPLTEDYEIELDKKVREYFQNWRVCGMSIMLMDGTEINNYFYGETKRGNGVLPDANTLYEVGSLTKTFTGIACIRWLQSKDISLDSSVINFLPERCAPGLTKNGVDVSFRHLLTHTSGLPLNAGSWYDRRTNDQIYSYLETNMLKRTPGTKPVTESDLWDYYSNLAFAVLGTILERNTSMTLQEIYSKYIFSEADMQTSTVTERVDTLTNIAIPYSPDGEDSYVKVAANMADGGIKSNVTDLAKYAQLLLAANSSDSLGNAILTSFSEGYSLSGGVINYICQPWHKQDYSNWIAYTHPGDTYGFSCMFSVNISTQKAAVFLLNYAPRNSGFNQMSWSFIEYLFN